MIPSCVFSLFGCKHKEEGMGISRNASTITGRFESLQPRNCSRCCRSSLLCKWTNCSPPNTLRRSSVHHTSFPFLFRLHPVENLLLEGCIGTVHTATADPRKITGRSDGIRRFSEFAISYIRSVARLVQYLPPKWKALSMLSTDPNRPPYWATESKIC